MIKSRYIFTDNEIDLSRKLAEDLNLPHEIGLLLIKQGINTKLDADAFFYPEFDDLHDPMKMKNMDISILRVKKAIDENQKITIFCDYDVDGTSACSILYLYFKSQNVNVDYHTPDRKNDGYGMNNTAVNNIIKGGTDLVVTVDCGITNIEQVAGLRKSGVDVIVTDHHECGEALPDTPYILNPKQFDCDYPYQFLSGAGIAFKLVQGLCGKKAKDYIDYAALGTIADIVPLTGENRVISKLGLEKMNKHISTGIGLLRPYVLPDGKKIDEYHIGFGFGPRINAAGRMDTAHLALKMLLATTKSEEAIKAAQKLNRLNDERKAICEAIIIEAEEQINAHNMLKDTGAIFVMGDWEPGVVGICASRLASKYARPVLIFAKKGDEAVCSARSIDAINIYDVLNNFSKYYIKFGGHHMAAGLTIKADDFNKLEADVNDHIKKQYPESTFIPKAVYDIEIKGSVLDDTFASALKKLAPYGQENPKPKLLFKSKAVKEKNYFGKQAKSHFKFSLETENRSIFAIKFYFSKKEDMIKSADIIGSININDYSGKPEIFIDYFESAGIDENMSMPVFAHENTVDHMVESFETDENKLSDMVPLKDVVTYIKNMADRSRFGLLIMLDDVFAFKLLVDNDIIKAMIASGKIGFKLEDDYGLPLNAFSFSKKTSQMIKPYDELLVFNEKNDINHPKIKVMRIKELNEIYQTEKTAYAPDKEALGKIFMALKSIFNSNRRFKTYEELYKLTAKNSGTDIRKTISGIKILSELDLIDLEKSDMIIGKIINHTEKKDLEASKIYIALRG